MEWLVLCHHRIGQLAVLACQDVPPMAQAQLYEAIPNSVGSCTRNKRIRPRMLESRDVRPDAPLRLVLVTKDAERFCLRKDHQALFLDAVPVPVRSQFGA